MSQTTRSNLYSASNGLQSSRSSRRSITPRAAQLLQIHRATDLDPLSDRSHATTANEQYSYEEEFNILRKIGVGELLRSTRCNTSIHIVEPKPIQVVLQWRNLGIPFLFRLLFFPLESLRAKDVPRSMMLSLVIFCHMLWQIVSLSMELYPSYAVFVLNILILIPELLLYLASRTTLSRQVALALPFMSTCGFFVMVGVNGPQDKLPLEGFLISYAIPIFLCTLSNRTTPRANMFHGILSLIVALSFNFIPGWSVSQVRHIVISILLIFLGNVMVAYIRDSMGQDQISMLLSSKVPVAIYSCEFQLIEYNKAFQYQFSVDPSQTYSLQDFMTCNMNWNQLHTDNHLDPCVGVGMDAEGADFWSIIAFDKIKVVHTYPVIHMQNLSCEVESVKRGLRLSDIRRDIQSNKQSLAYGSHDMLNYVSCINMAILSLRKRSKQSYVIDVLNCSTLMLEYQLRDTLDALKSKNHALKIYSCPFNMVIMVEEVVQILACYALQREVQLMCKIDPLMPVEFIGDQGRIKRILVNLVLNAIKFTNKGYVIVKALMPQGCDSVEFQVIDNGEGMTPETRARIFRPWDQGDLTERTSNRNDGVGLGLTSVKQQIALLQGSIKVESEKGRGSTFSVSLPLSPISSPPPPIPNFSMPPIRALLIMERGPLSELTMDMIKQLSERPLFCEIVSDEEQAHSLLRLRRQEYNLVFVDYNFRRFAETFYLRNISSAQGNVHDSEPDQGMKATAGVAPAHGPLSGTGLNTHHQGFAAAPGVPTASGLSSGLQPLPSGLPVNISGAATNLPTPISAAIPSPSPAELLRSRATTSESGVHASYEGSGQPFDRRALSNGQGKHDLGFNADIGGGRVRLQAIEDLGDYVKPNRYDSNGIPIMDDAQLKGVFGGLRFVLFSNRVAEDKTVSTHLYSAKLFKPLQQQQLRRTIANLVEGTTRPEAQHSSFLSLRFLIADDNEMIRESLRIFLEDQGHVARFASNGPECVAIFRESLISEQSRFDIILLDQRMPDPGDGSEACRSIRNIESNYGRVANPIPIFFMSCEEMDSHDLYETTGANGHIDKTNRQQELMNIITHHCNPRPSNPGANQQPNTPAMFQMVAMTFPGQPNQVSLVANQTGVYTAHGQTLSHPQAFGGLQHATAQGFVGGGGVAGGHRPANVVPPLPLHTLIPNALPGTTPSMFPPPLPYDMGNNNNVQGNALPSIPYVLPPLIAPQGHLQGMGNVQNMGLPQRLRPLVDHQSSDPSAQSPRTHALSQFFAQPIVLPAHLQRPVVPTEVPQPQLQPQFQHQTQHQTQPDVASDPHPSSVSASKPDHASIASGLVTRFARTDHRVYHEPHYQGDAPALNISLDAGQTLANGDVESPLPGVPTT
eukprot:TRINITY_DN9603_c0_g1_i1.p1 TRINITY_DN9603_c0_g1~~TRINITY_DN9603_c0_g1_i1.p1  ORF type:complete len:1369 (-),score=243.37 TRINITY_DN9603_c0_g1_i1:476-4582(-)